MRASAGRKAGSPIGWRTWVAIALPEAESPKAERGPKSAVVIPDPVTGNRHVHGKKRSWSKAFRRWPKASFDAEISVEAIDGQLLLSGATVIDVLRG
ncbi:hypothetical protein MESS2_610040 [Mesorhizobium metallidurans STM 2683]|uniref:Uncharacterized protein n=1 Tax=Mesorhizobium metallidurans STM 2683 TaxID=1297569 RepID=M5ERU7_9HYPH|nr:hypothetical protein MESS2_610040 [Mesorhizobium metallidurans STM 2683]